MKGRALRALAVFVPCWIGMRVCSLTAPEEKIIIPPVSAAVTASAAQPDTTAQPAVQPDEHLNRGSSKIKWHRPVFEQRVLILNGAIPFQNGGQTPLQAAPLPFFQQIEPLTDAKPAHSLGQNHQAPQTLSSEWRQPPIALAMPAQRSLLSGSSWMLLRNSSSRQSLAAQGQLGGSQVGAHAMVSLTQNKSLRLDGFARATSPLRTPKGKEVAMGVRVSNQAPVVLALQVERRLALDKEGRSAFAITGIAAVNDYRLANTVNLRGYIQTGVVGMSKRDAFVDGHAVVGMSIKKDRVTAGLGLWGAAQPGLSRLDVGPEIRLRPKALPQSAIALQWRHRVAGDAAPNSGIALVLGADF
jgi:hypothetical protein